MTASRLVVTADTSAAFPGAPSRLVDLAADPGLPPEVAAAASGSGAMLVVTGADVAQHGPTIRRWRSAGVAVVHLDPGRRSRLQRADARVSSAVTADRDVLLGAIDPAVTNPVGWRRQPPIRYAVALHAPTAAAGTALSGLPPAEVRVLVPETLATGTRRAALGGVPATSWADAAAFRDLIRRAAVLLSDPTWDDDPAATFTAVVVALASGTPVVTTADAPAARHGLPVRTVPDASHLVAAAADLVGDDVVREQVSVAGRRAVLQHHTGVARWRALAAEVGLADPAPPPRVSVLLATNRPEFIAHGIRSVLGQAHPDVELVLCLHGDAVDVPDEAERTDRPVQVVRVPAERVLGEVLNAGLDVATGELIAKMDDDDWYGRHHLGDLVLALDYRGADLVGKRIDHVHLAGRDLTVTRRRAEPERDRPHVSGPTLLTTTDLLRRERFDAVPRRVDSTLLERLVADGRVVYGTHALDVVLHRHGGNTWDADVAALLDDAERTTPGLDFDTTASGPGTYITS